MLVTFTVDTKTEMAVTLVKNYYYSPSISTFVFSELGQRMCAGNVFVELVNK